MISHDEDLGLSPSRADPHYAQSNIPGHVLTSTRLGTGNMEFIEFVFDYSSGERKLGRNVGPWMYSSNRKGKKAVCGPGYMRVP